MGLCFAIEKATGFAAKGDIQGSTLVMRVGGITGSYPYACNGLWRYSDQLVFMGHEGMRVRKALCDVLRAYECPYGCGLPTECHRALERL